MSIIGLGLVAIGGIIAFIGGIMLLIQAFRESVLWGLGCLFVPFVTLIFAVMHWDEAKKPFFIQIGGSVLAVIGFVLMAMFGKAH